MKFRNGFVSNSSSSSFLLIANKKRNLLEEDFEITVKPRVGDFVKHGPITDIKEYIKERYWCTCSYEEYISTATKDELDHLKNLEEELSKGNAIYIMEVSTEDYDNVYASFISREMCDRRYTELKWPKGVKQIGEVGGY